MGCPCNSSSTFSPGCGCSTCGGNGCGHDDCCCKPFNVCQSAVPDGCDALETTSTAQRIVVEDEDFCKKTIETSQGSLLSVSSEGNVDWFDGSEEEPILLPDLQSSEVAIPSIMGLNSDGEFTKISPSEENQIIVSQDGTTAEFGSLADIIDTCGLVYKDCDDGEVKTLTGNSSQIVAFDADGNPIASDGSSFVTGASLDAVNLSITYSNNNTIQVSSDYLIVRTSSNSKLQLQGVSVNIDRTASGAGGIDTGSVAASKMYWIYVIYNPDTATISAVASLSGSSPTLPSGYTYYRKVGGFTTTSGSNWFSGCFQKGNIFMSIHFSSTAWAIGNGATLSFEASHNADMLSPVAMTLAATAIANEVREIGFCVSSTAADVALWLRQVSTVGSNPFTDSYANLATTANIATLGHTIWMPLSTTFTAMNYQIDGDFSGSCAISESGYRWNFI